MNCNKLISMIEIITKNTFETIDISIIYIDNLYDNIYNIIESITDIPKLKK